MDFIHEFRVSLPMAGAWELFTDVPRLAPCMPGARLTDVEGERFHGTVKIKVGPVTTQYKGTATFEERDEGTRTVRLKAAGQDIRGQGNADAHITVELTPDGDGTKVTVRTRLTITGKAAQFGKGVIEDISRKLLGQFVACLERQLAAERGAEEPGQQVDDGRPRTAQAAPGEPTSATETASATPEPAARSRPSASRPVLPAESTASADGEALDLLDLARGALLKRLLPAAAGALILLGLALWLRHAQPRRTRRQACGGPRA